MAKKSLYLFLTSLLGVILFLILHRVIFFIYDYLIATGAIAPTLDYYESLVVEYFSLSVCLILGSWYGIWLGLYWFGRVYEEQNHGGLVHHISTKYFPVGKHKNLESKMIEVKQRLEDDLYKLEDLAQNVLVYPVESNPKPIKRKVVRKRAPKKLNKI